MKSQVYAYAKIGGEHNGVFLRGGSDGGFARIVKPRGADDHFDAFGGAFFNQRQRRAGAGEINQHIRVVQGDVCIVGYFHAGFDAQRKARIQAQYARACAVQRARQNGVGIGFNGLHQRSAHAPVCARNGDFQLCHDVLLILQFVETRRFAHARSPKRCLQCG